MVNCTKKGVEQAIYPQTNYTTQQFYTKEEYDKLQAENERLKARLRPLEDSYFKGLSSIEIAELAKKSIRVTAENRKLEYALQEIREIAGFHTSKDDSEDVQSDMQDILDKINEVIGGVNET